MMSAVTPLRSVSPSITMAEKNKQSISPDLGVVYSSTCYIELFNYYDKIYCIL